MPSIRKRHLIVSKRPALCVKAILETKSNYLSVWTIKSHGERIGYVVFAMEIEGMTWYHTRKDCIDPAKFL